MKSTVFVRSFAHGGGSVKEEEVHSSSARIGFIFIFIYLWHARLAWDVAVDVNVKTNDITQL